MKTTLLAATLVVTLSLSAAAAQKKPPMSQHLAGSSVAGAPPIMVPPPLCDPCLFYGGDLSPDNPNAAGLSSENTLLVAGSATYGNFNVASSQSVTVTGILFNVQADTNFDPQTASYDIRQNVSEGSGGEEIASGSGSIAVAATGRNFLGLNEYTVVVPLPSALVLATGSYWFSVTPNCTNGASDGSCYDGRIFVSNVTGRTNSIRSGEEGHSQMFLNSAYFGITFANWCDSEFGLNSKQCDSLSFGVLGYVNP